MFDPRLLLVAVVWAVNFAVVKFALTDFSPLSFTVVRFALSSLFLVLVMLATREPLCASNAGTRCRSSGSGLIGITMYNLFFMFGLKYTTASNSALFISTSPLFAALFLAFRKNSGSALRYCCRACCSPPSASS